jgi:oligo-1,6-glucosidase
MVAIESVQCLAYATITVGEAPFSHSADELAKYVLPANGELDMVFQFELMDIDGVGYNRLNPSPWTLPDLKRVVDKWQTFKRDEGYWNAFVVSDFEYQTKQLTLLYRAHSVYIQNHDQARAVSRFGNDSPQWRAISAKLLCMLEITQSGTLYIYQGEEIGMKNFPRNWGLEEYKDVASQNYYRRLHLSCLKSGTALTHG